MKKFSLLSFFMILSFLSSGQGGIWTWISGSSNINDPGVYGTQGLPSVNNHPPAMYEGAEWKDKQGNFWVYGGWNKNIVYSALWKYNPATNEWTWVQGDTLTNDLPVYGIKGVSNPSNSPSGRDYASATWVDTTGNLWLFGGSRILTPVIYNDLWKYDIAANNWIWMSGDNTGNSNGIHGTQGVPASSNVPGSRLETCSAWTDSLNNLWLWGGKGIDDNGTYGLLDDLCKYDISANEWTWMKGSALANYPSNYGVKGMASAGNDPGGRYTYTKWKDVNDNFWLMGGFAGNANNDVWKYDLNINQWTWMDGPDVTKDTGSYQRSCSFVTLNTPSSRGEQRSSVTDNCGRFWLFGGAYLYSSDFLNDLWVFDPNQLQWEWLSGINVFNQAGNYGMLGVPSPANLPPSRWGALAWWGNDNRFYLFGGSQSGTQNPYSDLWVFNPDTNCIQVCKSIILPVSDIESKDEISIYPNPVKDNLQFAISNKQFANCQLQILNVMGQAILKPEIRNPKFVIDISSLSAGIYFVHVINGNKRWVGKFVKE